MEGIPLRRRVEPWPGPLNNMQAAPLAVISWAPRNRFSSGSASAPVGKMMQGGGVPRAVLRGGRKIASSSTPSNGTVTCS